MSDEMMLAIEWGIMFCAPAAVIIAAWYWIDEIRGKRENVRRTEDSTNGK